MSDEVTEEHGKKLESQIASLKDHRSHALASVYSGMWLQYLGLKNTAAHYARIVSYGEKGFLEIIEDTETAFDVEFGQKHISSERIHNHLCILADFVSSYPTSKKIKGAEYVFAKHPTLKDSWGITAKGLEILNDVVRSFLLRKNAVACLRWDASPTDAHASVSTDEFKTRCVSFSCDNASCASTDEFLAAIRSRFIARSMKKRALYAWKNMSYVKTKDFYLCMREIEPEKINTVHHIGSTPVLVALEDPKENDVLRQIIVCNVMASYLDTLFKDDTFGDEPPTRAQLRKVKTKEALGFFCGRYVHITSQGKLVEGGEGWDGIKAVILTYTSRHAPPVYRYLCGESDVYRTTTEEDEHAASTCF